MYSRTLPQNPPQGQTKSVQSPPPQHHTENPNTPHRNPQRESIANEPASVVSSPFLTGPDKNHHNRPPIIKHPPTPHPIWVRLFFVQTYSCHQFSWQLDSHPFPPKDSSSPSLVGSGTSDKHSDHRWPSMTAV